MQSFSLKIKPGCSSLRCCVISRDFGSVKDGKNPSVIKLNERTGKKSGGRKEENKKFKKSSLLLLAVPGIAFGLGCWQVQRLRWKLNYIEELEKQLNTEAIDFPINDLNNLDKYEYQRVHLKGRFLFEKEFVIAPRGRFDKDYKQKSSGLAGDAESSSHGGHVITPFAVDKSNLIIMVNRGWLPTSQLLNRPIPKEHLGVIELDAIIRKSEIRPTFVSENIPEKNCWFYKNFEQMAKTCGSSPICVEATNDFTKPGGPIAGQTNVNVRNDHVQYLTTWFTLSAITTAMWYFKFVK